MDCVARLLLVLLQQRIVVVHAALLQAWSQQGAFLLLRFDFATLSIQDFLDGDLCEFAVELFLFLAILKWSGEGV